VLGARGLGWKALHVAGRAGRISPIPDYVDLVTHEAYQEALGFGRPWLLPVEDERVYVHEYATSPETGAIVARDRRVKTFDGAWLASVARRNGPGSLGALLLAQGRVVTVDTRGPSGSLLRELPLGLLAMIAFAALLTRERRAPGKARRQTLRAPGDSDT
ncbi:MAG TPA: hypothetical protein VHE79_12875, partial [Spirochaetia bacterium]